MTTRIAVLVVVTFVSACGAGARPPAASSKPALAEPITRTAAEQGSDDDYVVGPFETSSAGVRTYYIVRN